MASLWFNRGLKTLIENTFFTPASPGQFFAALVTNRIVPAPTMTNLAHLEELPNANGYTTGGLALTRGPSDFPVITEDATGFVELTLRDLVWTAAGGGIPHTGLGASYLVLTGPGTTVNARELICAIDLQAPTSIADTEVLTIRGVKLRLSQPASIIDANIFTTRGLKVLIENLFRVAPSTTYYAALIDYTSPIPTINTATLGNLTQCVSGNGYFDGGIALNRGTDFLNLTEDSLLNRVTFQVPQLTWTATGGQLPVNSNGARWLALTDANASVGARNVLVTACLKADRAKAAGESMLIPPLTVRLDN